MLSFPYSLIPSFHLFLFAADKIGTGTGLHAFCPSGLAQGCALPPLDILSTLFPDFGSLLCLRARRQRGLIRGKRRMCAKLSCMSDRLCLLLFFCQQQQKRLSFPFSLRPSAPSTSNLALIPPPPFPYSSHRNNTWRQGRRTAMSLLPFSFLERSVANLQRTTMYQLLRKESKKPPLQIAQDNWPRVTFGLLAITSMHDWRTNIFRTISPYIKKTIALLSTLKEQETTTWCFYRAE